MLKGPYSFSNLLRSSPGSTYTTPPKFPIVRDGSSIYAEDYDYGICRAKETGHNL